MNLEVDIDPKEIDNCLSSLDSWVDAFKDVSLVSVGILASFLSLVYGGELGLSFIMIILAVSILSGMFLPYKIAVTRKSTLGVFSRYRAIEVMIVILICWMVPTILVLFFPAILLLIPPSSESMIVSNILSMGLSVVAFLMVAIFASYGMKRMFLRIGISDSFLTKYSKYSWGLGYNSLSVVSLTVVNIQLRLLEAVQTYAQSVDLAIIIYARAFGGLIVLIVFSCTITYFEPKRILTRKGEIVLGLVGLGVLVALVEPLIGFILSLSSLLILIWYSLSLPTLDIEFSISQKEETERNDDFRNRLFRIRYGKNGRIAYTLTWIMGIVGMGGIFIVIIFEDRIPFLSTIVMPCLIACFILYFTIRMEKLRLYWGIVDYLISVEDTEEISDEKLTELLFRKTGHRIKLRNILFRKNDSS